MVAITAYAVFGGADFGAGFWDLVAGGAARGERPREVIDHSIGPVWEANHVWLIFCFVVLWTGFPEAYASITLTLFVPLTLAAFGDRAARDRASRSARPSSAPATAATSVPPSPPSSVLVPYCLGAVAGAIASGRVPAGGRAGDPWTSWVNPTSVLGGVLAVVVVAYLAAVYLVWDARRIGERRWSEYFRRRAVAAAVVAGVVAFVGDLRPARRRPLPLRRADPRALCRSSSCPRSAARRRSSCSCATPTAAPGSSPSAPSPASSSAGASPNGRTSSPRASRSPTRPRPPAPSTALLVATVGAALIVLPGFILLYTLDQKSLLPAEGVD